MHNAALLLGEEVAGTAKMISYEVVEDDDQDNGYSSREEGGYPHYDSSVGLIAVMTPGLCHILPVHRKGDRCDIIDPAQWHRDKMGHEDNSNTGQFSDPGLGEVLLGYCAAENKVALDGEYHHYPGGAVHWSILQESQDATPGLGMPEGPR